MTVPQPIFIVELQFLSLFVVKFKKEKKKTDTWVLNENENKINKVNVFVSSFFIIRRKVFNNQNQSLCILIKGNSLCKNYFFKRRIKITQ